MPATFLSTCDLKSPRTYLVGSLTGLTVSQQNLMPDSKELARTSLQPGVSLNVLHLRLAVSRWPQCPPAHSCTGQRLELATWQAPRETGAHGAGGRPWPCTPQLQGQERVKSEAIRDKQPENREATRELNALSQRVPAGGRQREEKTKEEQ